MASFNKIAHQEVHFDSLRDFILPYATLIFFLALLSFGGAKLLEVAPHVGQDIDFQLLMLGGILFVGYYINKIAPRTVIPSFVWAIFAGMALQPLLGFYTENISALHIAMELFGAIILFAGGMEIPFKNFKKWFLPIASLSLFGVLISALGFSLLLYGATRLLTPFDVFILPSIVVLSVALTSTDPTAIIPTLKQLNFKRKFLKQIAISETALTDVSGSVFTRFLLLALVSVPLTQSSTVFTMFEPLFRKATYDALALQIITGVLVGYLGFAIIKKFYYIEAKRKGKLAHNAKSKKKVKIDADPALLLAVPIFTFVIGNVLGGAGFLAAFVSGLLADVRGGLRSVSHFYENILDHLIKPFIFVVLGALVPTETLFALAPLGILAALLFMFVIRPFVVTVSLLPWIIKGVFRLGDIIFLSFIRETGIIAAILIIIASSSQIIVSDYVIAIGMWVILLTLIIEPPLTPYVAREAGVATLKKNI